MTLSTPPAAWQQGARAEHDRQIYVKKTEHFTLCITNNDTTKTATIKIVVLQSGTFSLELVP